MASDTQYVDTKVPTKRLRVEPKTPKGGFASYNVYAFVGPCGAGKTYACSQLLRQQCRDGQVKRVYVIGPTVTKNHAWDAVRPWIMGTCEDAEEAEEFMHEMRKRCVAEYDCWETIRKNYSRANFRKILQSGKASDGYDRLVREFARDRGPEWYDDAPCSALVCDDCMGTNLFNYSRQSTYSNMLIRHRHLGMNVYALVQGLKNSFPRHLRLNVRCWMLWRFGDKRIVQDLFSEASGALCDEGEFHDMYSLLTGKNDRGENTQPKGRDFLVLDAKTADAPFRAGLNVAASCPAQLMQFCCPRGAHGGAGGSGMPSGGGGNEHADGPDEEDGDNDDDDREFVMLQDTVGRYKKVKRGVAGFAAACQNHRTRAYEAESRFSASQMRSLRPLSAHAV